jgi:uncharacterized membrane protein
MITAITNQLKQIFDFIETKLNLYNHKFYFFMILGFGIILRIFCFTENGLWIDEIWSMHASNSQRNISEIIAMCIADTHPPLFDILLHGVLKLTNDYEFTGRYLGLFFGVIGIALTHFYTFKITHSRRLSLITMALVSFNYFHIIYSFEGRFYSLVYILSLISIAELYLFLTHQKLKHLIIFIITNVLLVYTHYYGGILLTALSIVVFALLLFKEITFKLFIKYVLACAVIFLSFLPWLPYMLGKEGTVSWMQVPNPIEFIVYFALYTGKNPIETAILLFPLIFTFKLYRTNKKLAFLLVGSIVLGFLIPFIVSHLFTPLLHVRYTIIYLPSVLILAALFWDRLEIISINLKKWIAGIVFLSMMVSLLVFSVETKEGYKDGWKGASLVLNRSNATNIFTEHNLYLNYYLDYHGEKNAGDFDDFLKSEYDDLWLLKTPYDTKNMFEVFDLNVIQEHHLSNNFILYQVTRK